MIQLSFETPVLDDKGIFTPPWQRSLGSIAAGSLSEAWQPYTPQVIGLSGMTVSAVNVIASRYQANNSICLVDLYVGFNTAGSPGTTIYLSLPKPYGGSYQTGVLLTGLGSDGVLTYKPLVGIIQGASSQYVQVFAGGNSTTNWTNGSHAISATFAYNCLP